MSMPLQDGLYGLCALALQKEHGGRITVDAGVFAEFRTRLLRETVRHAYKRSRFYRKLFDAHGLHPQDIRGMEDLINIPFTNPQDLAGNNYDFLCISQGSVEKPVTYHSSGTTGVQKRMYFSRADVEEIKKFLAVGMRTVADCGDAVQIILPNTAERGIGSVLGNALQQNGMHAVVTNVFDDSSRQIGYTLKNRPTVWFGDAGVIYRITKEMERSVELASFGVKVLFLTMGHVSETMRSNLEKSWRCRVCTHYGLTETGWGLAVECPAVNGYHYNQYGIIAEVVNPSTGEPVPEGSDGELVFTSLGREAMPLLRYRSRDIASIRRPPCACGSMLDTIGPVRFRRDAVAFLPNGTELWAQMFDDTIYSFENAVDYNITLEQKRGRAVLTFQVEVVAKTNQVEMRDALASLQCVRQGQAIVHVRQLQAGALKAACLRKKLIRIKDE